VRDGAEDEFAEFYAAAWGRMFRVAYAITGDVAEAEDAVQSAFVKAFASWRRVSTADNRDAYLRRMVVNEVLGVRRRLWWRTERAGSPPDAPARGSVEDDVADRSELWLALGSLAPRQRAVLVLRYYEDLSEQQIADVLGCSRGTVKSQASDGLAALRRHHSTAVIREKS
jgi:RNA polymerase sigma-70 factor (sigma-E family)